MSGSEYTVIVGEALERFRLLSQQREEIDVELSKLRQFLYAALNMVPDDEREKLEREVTTAIEKATASVASLAASIRKIFEENSNTGYSVGGVRSKLLEVGFDFSSYKSNPLSSISTTLRRMVETGELKTHESDEGNTFCFPSDSRKTRAPEKQAPVTDLMAALKKSLADSRREERAKAARVAAFKTTIARRGGREE
jgi:hypothetical protein